MYTAITNSLFAKSFNLEFRRTYRKMTEKEKKIEISKIVEYSLASKPYTLYNVVLL